MRFTYALLSSALASLAACPGQGKDTGTDTDTTAATDTAASTAMTASDATTTGTSTPTTALTSDEAVPCAGAVPPDGSACATEGEDCKFEDDLCVAFTGARCDGGVWVHYQNVPEPACDGPSACEPPNFPSDGDPCSEEGASCSSDCSDQCLFCNAWTCQDGAWKHVEVPPIPCLECDALCDFVVVPMCAGGPPDKATCVSGCEDNKVGACKAEFSELRACAGKQPTFACDMAERPVVAGCEAAFTAFYDCLMP